MMDAHVHLHPGCEARDLFEGARSNFRRARAHLGLPHVPGVLLLADVAGQAAFPRLCEDAGGAADGRWTLEASAEEDSLLARRDGVLELVLVAGRQIRTGEGLEVLAFGQRRDEPEGRPVEDVLEHVWSAGAPAIVPWGFGKWWLGRGRRLAALIEHSPAQRFFLGDNGGRPRVAAESPLFARAAQRGIRDLPGTDPLPFPGQERRAGSYGSVVAGHIDLRTPATALRSLLGDTGVSPKPYGRRRRLLPFVRDQVGMQLRRRRP